MKNYCILDHRDGRTEAVKAGFSWPAFVFGLFWCVAKELWWHATIIAVGTIAFVGAALAATLAAPNWMPALNRLGELLGFFVGLVCGFAGNSWRTADLMKQGFAMRSGFVEAKSASDALRASGGSVIDVQRNE